MITRNRIKIQEKEIISIWERLLGEKLLTEGRERICVIYPGRVNKGSGPDFRDAVILAGDNKLIKGDIEIHTRASDWYSHGHHCDPEYNDVILHVVLWNDDGYSTFTTNGKFVPVICLAKSLQYQARLMPYHQLPCFCSGEKGERQDLKKLLQDIGVIRFKQRVEMFSSKLLKEEASQVLFQGIMRALGYTKNKRAFEELARRLPLWLLEGELKGSLLLKEAMLLGMAGLLPSQRVRCLPFVWEEWVKELEQTWHSFGRGETMYQSDWCLTHIYPNNSPVRRIVAQSYLLHRYRVKGLLPNILELVTEAPLTKEAYWLESNLMVVGDGYWLDHFDFDVGSRIKKSALLGRDKAGEIVVNVILPFTFSWWQATGERELQQKALQLYLEHPKLAGNEITCHMVKQLFIEHNSGLTACQHQGLIHLFKDYCCQAKCSECPLVSQG
jgi:hypothetical protein